MPCGATLCQAVTLLYYIEYRNQVFLYIFRREKISLVLFTKMCSMYYVDCLYFGGNYVLEHF